MLVQLVGRVELLESPGLEHRHPVAQIERLLLLVGDEDGRDPDPLDERPQLAPGALAQRRVQVGQRLVQEQHSRLPSERAREGHALLLPPRELLHAPPLEPLEAHQPEDLRHLGVVRAPPGESKRDVLSDVEVGEQRVMLEHHPTASLCRRHRRHVLPREHDATGVGGLEPSQQAQHCGLAAARRAEQHENLAARDFQREGSDGHGVRPLLAHTVQGDEPAHRA